LLEPYREANERYQFQMGPVRGNLATALDILTDALALVGQHGVYCRSQRQPQFPAMDIHNPPFYPKMILLHDIVQIFAESDPHTTRHATLGFQFAPFADPFHRLRQNRADD